MGHHVLLRHDNQKWTSLLFFHTPFSFKLFIEPSKTLRVTPSLYILSASLATGSWKISWITCPHDLIKAAPLQGSAVLLFTSLVCTQWNSHFTSLSLEFHCLPRLDISGTHVQPQFLAWALRVLTCFQTVPELWSTGSSRTVTAVVGFQFSN